MEKLTCLSNFRERRTPSALLTFLHMLNPLINFICWKLLFCILCVFSHVDNLNNVFEALWHIYYYQWKIPDFLPVEKLTKQLCGLKFHMFFSDVTYTHIICASRYTHDKNFLPSLISEPTAGSLALTIQEFH